MKAPRLRYHNNIIISYININSVRYKFQNFVDLASQYLDVIIIAETKLDDTFPPCQFHIPGFKSPYRLDVTSNSGGLLVHVNEHIISKELRNLKLPKDIQAIPIELNFRKRKWLLLPLYRPPDQDEAYFVDQLQRISDFYTNSSQQLLVIGNFSMVTSNPILSSYIENSGLYSLLETPTCFKSRLGRCFDLMLTNMKYSFMQSQSFETGFSDFHHLVHTILKVQHKKLPPKRIQFRDYRNFSKENFEADLSSTIAEKCPYDLQEFELLFDETLGTHAPLKTVTIRGNNKPHMTKSLRKAMMLRTKLKNRANKTRDQADMEQHRKQKNLVVKINKVAKREFYTSLDPSKIETNRSFWRTFKPLFWNSESREKITLIEDDKIVVDDKTIGQYFNNYFTNITDTLKIPRAVHMIPTKETGVPSMVRDEWATALSALLTGKALDVYSRLPDDTALDYEKVKEALLIRYQIKYIYSFNVLSVDQVPSI